MQRQPRFKVIKHRNGTRTLIDNQTGLRFFRADDDSTIQAISILLDGKKTDTSKFYNNYIICKETMTH